jgi:transcriptional regulator with XRE-family HTH domain
MAMDPQQLADQLAKGRSIESIARETGRAPSTVAYWVNKHGLASAHASRHAARGGIERERLRALVEEGLSIRAMAGELGVSYTTVRHWLARHGLSTPRARRLAATAPARAGGAETTQAECPTHGVTTFVRRGTDGFRCRLCRSGAVQRRRRDIKRILVAEAGGACVLCGYDRTLGGLHFHHRDPAKKAFALSRQGVTRSLESARLEADKCVLLCSNCHAEVEAGDRQLPASLLL